MDLHKLAHDVCEVAKHWHLPVFVGLISSVKVIPKINGQGVISDLGEVPGDNVLPKEILNSLISRRSL